MVDRERRTGCRHKTRKMCSNPRAQHALSGRSQLRSSVSVATYECVRLPPEFRPHFGPEWRSCIKNMGMLHKRCASRAATWRLALSCGLCANSRQGLRFARKIALGVRVSRILADVRMGSGDDEAFLVWSRLAEAPSACESIRGDARDARAPSVARRPQVWGRRMARSRRPPLGVEGVLENARSEAVPLTRRRVR
jgi:hypothetical protein